ncbi:MAG TPA: hypothetical protein VED87_10740 [Methylocystis sp.]|nr:hypothetical protein [Methylocystis sp.]
MTLPAYAWAAFALVAAAAQMLRNAAQHDLTRRIGTAGATFVRFLYGLPFALAFFVLICLAASELPPLPDARALMAVVLAAAAQVLATALMLRAMHEKSFVVATALTKTEAMQIVLFGLLMQGAAPSVSLIVAAVCATAGVLILSGSTIGLYSPGDARSTLRAVAYYGLSSAAAFAVATVKFRDAILALDGASFLTAAAETLALGLILQTLAILCWLLVTDRATLLALAREWRSSLGAGGLGAFATLFWFFAFALASAARVRTVGLVEVLFAQLAAHRLFAERTTMREAASVALILAGVALALNGG